MIEELKQVRDALYDSKAEFWDDWNSNMSEGDFENHWLIMDIDKSLATLDRIIANHIPDACKIDVPALNELEHRLVNLGNTLDYNKSYPRKNITEEVDLIIKQFRTLRSNLSSAPTPAQPEKLNVEALKREIAPILWRDWDDLIDKEQNAITAIVDHLASAGYLRAPLPRIEGLEEALIKYGYIADQEDSQLSSSEEWYPVDEFKMQSIVKAARAYLKLQGGD